MILVHMIAPRMVVDQSRKEWFFVYQLVHLHTMLSDIPSLVHSNQRQRFQARHSGPGNPHPNCSTWNHPQWPGIGAKEKGILVFW